MRWPLPAQRVLLVAAALLLALFALAAQRAARRPALERVADEPALEVLLDLNAATAAELESLPGIGAARAAGIVAHREARGPFRSVDELRAVPGVGGKLAAALRPLVTAGARPPAQ